MAMDLTMGWLQTEQRGPASDLFSRLWAAQEGGKQLAGGRQTRVPDLIDHHLPSEYPAAEAAAAGAGAGAVPPPSRRPPPPLSNGAARERSCTTEFDLHREELVGRHGGTPWLLPGKIYSTGVDGLHEEIEDFFSYMSPTHEEHCMRDGVYASIRDVILSLWDGARVFIFGSFGTGLYLPTSDIDIVVMGSWEKSLEMLKDALIRADICDSSSIKVLDKAAVPIIKLTDRRTDVKVDISFNMKNGLLSANTIKQYQREFPQMPKLVIALKQFLLQRELNEVFTGGISSYSLILMTVGFLQDHERHMPPYVARNLGVLLIEFFELYGLKFNYLKTCIKVKDRGYAPRSEVEEQFAAHSAHNSPLCIEDPHNATNDIGRSSYNMMKVKEAFKYAYHLLSGAVLSPGLAADPNRHSILGRVIQVTDRVIEYRQSIRVRFPVPVTKRPSPQRAPSSSPHSSISPLSSGTSDASDQDAECLDPVGGAQPHPLTRDERSAGRPDHMTRDEWSAVRPDPLTRDERSAGRPDPLTRDERSAGRPDPLTRDERSAGRPDPLTRDGSPANSGSAAGGPGSRRSAPRSGPGPGPGPGSGAGPGGGGGAGSGHSSGAAVSGLEHSSGSSAVSSPGPGSNSGSSSSSSCSGHSASPGSGHGSGRGGHSSGPGRRQMNGSHHPAAGSGAQHHPPSRPRRGQNGSQNRRKAGGNGSSSQSDGAAMAGQGRPSRHHQPSRAQPRDS